MKKNFAFIFACILLISLVSSRVYINEVELNPAGADTGNEWIELYSDSGSVNMSGWYVTNKANAKNYLPNDTFSDFYVFNTTIALTNAGDNITLYNTSKAIIDSTGNISDERDDNKTNQRVPDGTGSFQFKEQTRNSSNSIALNQIIISQQASSPACILEGETATISANVRNDCIINVTFSILENGAWKNFSGKTSDSENFSALTDALPSGNLSWFVHASDCYNNSVTDNGEYLYIHPKTKLIISPNETDGKNGWYITKPVFTLQNPDANQIFYRWDGTSTEAYSSPFSLEGTLNNGNERGGVFELNFWSDVCSEKESTKALSIDLTSPEIKNLKPASGSSQENSTQEIYAYIDELNAADSGVKISSVVMTLDGNVVNATVNKSGLIDAMAKFIAANLSVGTHHTSVYAEDNSGRNTSASWNFEIISPSPMSLQVLKLSDGNYTARHQEIEILVNYTVKTLEIKNSGDKKPMFKPLCKNCNEYGKTRKKYINLNEGWNNITIKATDFSGNTEEKTILAFIDSVKPKIKSFSPKKNTVFNGSEFSIMYSESNLKNITLFYRNNSLNLNCSSGQNVVCKTSVNLSSYSGNSIDYYFEIFDTVGSFALTDSTKINIDTLPPQIKINSPQNKTYHSVTPFNITASEKVNLEYIDNSASTPSWRKLCTKCTSYGTYKKEVKQFTLGSHLLTFRATDEAGNTGEQEVEFDVE